MKKIKESKNGYYRCIDSERVLELMYKSMFETGKVPPDLLIQIFGLQDMMNARIRVTVERPVGAKEVHGWLIPVFERIKEKFCPKCHDNAIQLYYDAKKNEGHQAYRKNKNLIKKLNRNILGLEKMVGNGTDAREENNAR